MKIKFENFGKISSGSININDLTVICGPNNTGKTYTSYAVYGLLYSFGVLFDYGISDDFYNDLEKGNPVSLDMDEIVKVIPEEIKKAENKFSKSLPDLFNTQSDFFQNSKFEFSLPSINLDNKSEFSAEVRIGKEASIDIFKKNNCNELSFAYSKISKATMPRTLLKRIVCDHISEFLFMDIVPKPFVVTSERTGVALFYKELDVNKNALLSHIAGLKDRDINPFELIGAMQSRYAKPIQENIDSVRDYQNISKNKSFLRSDKKEYGFVFDKLLEIVGGYYKDEDGNLFFHQKKKRGEKKVSLPLYISSSSAKSLFLIDMYINHIAKKRGILIIDEPELNLHPDNQIKFARLITRLCNSGIKILITTHSDYLIRELNNMIAIGNTGNDKQDLMRKYGVKDCDIISKDKVSAYVTSSNGEIKEVNITSSGIDTYVFDDIISDENYKTQDISMSVESN